MYLFQQIEEIALLYRDTRKNIAEFVLGEKNKVLNMSMQEIADCNYTSKATLVRFAKTLGFRGWQEFVRAFMEESVYQETHYTSTDPNIPFTEDHSAKEIIHKISSLHMESILDTIDCLDISMLEQAVDRLKSASRIAVFGMNPNSFYGDLFKWKMLSIGCQVIVAKVGEAGMTARTLTSGDCGILISYSGNNPQKEPVTQLQSLLNNNVKLIGITGGGNNYIREHVDCVLTISSHERLYSKISNFSSEESILMILDLLYSCYFARDYQKNLTYKINNSRELESSREASLGNMKEW